MTTFLARVAFSWFAAVIVAAAALHAARAEPSTPLRGPSPRAVAFESLDLLEKLKVSGPWPPDQMLPCGCSIWSMSVLGESVNFADTPTIGLGPNDEVLIIEGTHSNSNQSYPEYALIFARDDKWRLIDSFATLSDRYCAFDRDETPHFSTRPGHSPIFRDIVVTVRETQKANATDCGEEKGARDYVRDYHAVYRWRAMKGRFIGDRSALKRLQEINGKRY